MNEPHENLDHDRFADDGRRRTRLRRDRLGGRRARLRRRCVVVGAAAPRAPRHIRPCAHADRGPLREWL